VDETFLEGARSGTVYAIVSKEDTYIGAAGQAIVNYFKGLDPDANHALLDRVQKVTVNDIYRVLETYAKPLFDANQSNVVITVNPSKVNSFFLSTI
jgi:Zn-dependent M16 (insulinase) family peptidase